jgi:hypothetical protein
MTADVLVSPNQLKGIPEQSTTAEQKP